MTSTAQQMPPPQTSGAGKVNTAFVQSKMQVPPGLQQAYERIIMAGKKIMYSPQMTPQIAALMKGDDTVANKLGQGAVALIALLISQSNHTLPPQLIIPCATELLTEFADFLNSTGVAVSDQDVASGMAVMVGQIMQRIGVTPQKLQAMMAAKKGAAPGAAPQAPPQPAGLVGGAMSSAPAPQGA